MFSSPSLGSLWKASGLTAVRLLETGSVRRNALGYGIAQHTRGISDLRVHEIASVQGTKAVDRVKAEAKEANRGTGESRQISQVKLN